MRSRGIRFATLTHAAGISSTGDPALDNLLPLNEPYSIPTTTAAGVNAARAHGTRIIAIGTTVVRALEAAVASNGVVRSGSGVATERIGAGTNLRVVDAVLTGTHEPGTSHRALLGAFLDQTSLRQIDAELDDGHYRTHEFGDSLFIERGARFFQVPRRRLCLGGAPRAWRRSAWSSCRRKRYAGARDAQRQAERGLPHPREPIELQRPGADLSTFSDEELARIIEATKNL
jgi:S-adenosylmethionine:tRNA ribosyltransferase-isomerase